jgi:acyl-ACP thioesterase
LSSLTDENQSSGAPAPGTWQEQVLVHAYDVDFRKCATAESICRWFLEAAWNHAEQLGVGFAALAQDNRFWVLVRLLVQIDQYPSWGQRSQLTTWPRGVSGVLALRDFELCDTSGRRLAAGTSSWLVLDAQSHRAQRLDKVVRQIPAVITRQALGRDPAKILPTEPGPARLNTAVRYSDIDVNHHVNSARYVGWCLDTYSLEFHHQHLLRSLEVNYTGETKWEDHVAVFSDEPSPLHFAHSIRNSKDEEVCRAELVWASVD